jgi:hypothetical protein
MEKHIDPKSHQKAAQSSVEGQTKPQKMQERIKRPLLHKHTHSNCFQMWRSRFALSTPF